LKAELKWFYGNKFANIRKLSIEEDYKQVFYTLKVFWVFGCTIEISSSGTIGVTLRCDPIALTLKLASEQWDE
tara:strand:- start:602 stop:820 length:219 start_codon:yes stop_codon:yes gene_type:complete